MRSGPPGFFKFGGTGSTMSLLVSDSANVRGPGWVEYVSDLPDVGLGGRSGTICPLVRYRGYPRSGPPGIRVDATVLER